MNAADLLDLPYDVRRLIVVSSGGQSAMDIGAHTSKDAEGERRPLMRFAPLLMATPSLAITAAAVTLLTSNFNRRAGDQGRLRLVSSDYAAEHLRFPVGHPRPKVVYVAHPVVRDVYIPVARFHGYLFEHKVAEAMRLLRGLGAQSIDIVHVRGWGRETGFNLAVGIPGAESVDASLRTESKTNSGTFIISTAKLRPSDEPHMPDDLVWLPHEPLWQELASARLESGLASFSIDVGMFDDYGVNAGLKLMVAKAGLDAGGSFVEHESTIWRFTGTFYVDDEETPPVQ